MIIKNKNSLRVIFSIFLLIFLSACSNRTSNSNFLMDKFIAFGEGVINVFSNQEAVYGLMFVAILFGSFALYKSLLRFAFRKSDQFKNKEINVIAFMISIISTAGIFFIFSSSPKLFIVLFGGSAGLLLVLFIVFFIMRIFYEFAENIKDEDGLLKKGPGWIFLIILGIILSSYLLLGYSTKVLKELSCSVDWSTLTAATSCNGGTLFTWIGSISLDILGWVIFLALIFGIWWLVARNKKGDEEDDDKDIGTLGRMFGGGSEKDKEKEKEVKNLQEKLKDIDKGISEINKSFNKQREILENINKGIKFNSGDNN